MLPPVNYPDIGKTNKKKPLTKSMAFDKLLNFNEFPKPFVAPHHNPTYDFSGTL